MSPELLGLIFWCKVVIILAIHVHVNSLIAVRIKDCQGIRLLWGTQFHK